MSSGVFGELRERSDQNKVRRCAGAAFTSLLHSLCICDISHSVRDSITNYKLINSFWSLLPIWFLNIYFSINMDATDKSSSKNNKVSQVSIYNPWNLFTTRNRTESETSVSSTSSQNSQSGETQTLYSYNFKSLLHKNWMYYVILFPAVFMSIFVWLSNRYKTILNFKIITPALLI